MNNEFPWEDVTRDFSEEQRRWKGTYLKIDEVAFDQIECSLFSDPDDLWEIYVSYGDAMYGVSYAPADKAAAQRKQMMHEIEEEYKKNELNPSSEFINNFAKKYNLDVSHAVF